MQKFKHKLCNYAKDIFKMLVDKDLHMFRKNDFIEIWFIAHKNWEGLWCIEMFVISK